jgi:hypothetical protein
MPQGLTSTGEFGPLLQIVLTDSANGKLAWSHWERMRDGIAAVFRYVVPEQGSHFTVNFCCVPSVASSPAGDRKPREVSSRQFHGNPGYHGFLYLDSETGAVLRMTIAADFDAPGPAAQVGEWVEYGIVKIGDHDYRCPVSTTAFIHLPPWRIDDAGFMNLNEVTFTNYHRFGSTAHILPAPPEP